MGRTATNGRQGGGGGVRRRSTWAGCRAGSQRGYLKQDMEWLTRVQEWMASPPTQKAVTLSFQPSPTPPRRLSASARRNAPVGRRDAAKRERDCCAGGLAWPHHQRHDSCATGGGKHRGASRHAVTSHQKRPTAFLHCACFHAGSNANARASMRNTRWNSLGARNACGGDRQWRLVGRRVSAAASSSRDPLLCSLGAHSPRGACCRPLVGRGPGPAAPRA